MASGLGRGFGRGLSQLGQQLMAQAEDKKRQDRQDKMMIDERLMRQGEQDNANAEARRRMTLQQQMQRDNTDYEYGLNHPVMAGGEVNLPFMGGFNVPEVRYGTPLGDRFMEATKPAPKPQYGGFYTGAGADRSANAGTYGRGGGNPPRDFVAEHAANRKFDIENPKPGDLKPDMRVVAVPVDGKIIMMTPQEAAAVGYYYNTGQKKPGFNFGEFMQNLLGGGQQQADPYDELFKRLSTEG